MKDIELREHGMHVGIDLADPGLDLSDALPDEETVKEHHTGSTTTRRLDKSRATGATPRAMGRIGRIYPHAIEYTGGTRGWSGAGFTVNVLLGGMFAGIGLGFGVLTASFDTSDPPGAVLLMFCMAVFFVLWGVSIVVGTLNDMLFVPEDLPVVFDRRQRKVYRLLQDKRSDFFNLFRPQPLVACEYEWDLLDVEYRNYTDSELPVQDDHFLDFLARRCRQSPWLVDKFTVLHAYDKGSLESMWEHIRRFMDEGGPHLPEDGESLACPPAPLTWRERLGLEGKSRPLFLVYWRQSLPRALLCLPLFLMGLPFRLVHAAGDYLATKTALATRWPVVVMQRLGVPLAAGSGADSQCEGSAA